MFKRFAVQTKLVRVPANANIATNDGTDAQEVLGPELVQAYADIAKDLITHAALTVGGVFAACKIVERICK